METDNGGNEVGMKDLEVYFNNLAAAAINEKLVLEQLVANNSKLIATNTDLVVLIKTLSKDIKNLKRETSRLNKMGVSGASQGKREPTFLPHCKS